MNKSFYDDLEIKIKNIKDTTTKNIYDKETLIKEIEDIENILENITIIHIKEKDYWNKTHKYLLEVKNFIKKQQWYFY